MSRGEITGRHWPDQHSLKNKKMRRDTGYELVENPSSIANRSPQELWEDLPSPPYAGMSTQNSQTRHTSSSFGKSPRQEQSSAGNILTFIPSKEEKTREIRKKLREQEMLRKRRIVQEQRREESRRALVEEHQQKMKLQWQTKNKMKQEVNHARKRSVNQTQADWKHGIMVKIMREDEARIRQLGETRDILRKEKDDAYYDKVVGHLRDMEDNIFKNKSDQVPEGPDKVYTELWYRQEKLFRALGERSLKDIKDMLAFTPTILQVKAKKIYQDYSPHRHMQQLLNDLIANRITEQFFFKESAELVKKMSPSRIIEHHRRQEARKTGSYRLLKVSSQPAINRFVIAWSAAKLDDERAKTVAAKVVTDTLRHARSVYSQLMEGSSADLTLLGISALDVLQEKVSQQLKEFGSGISIGGGDDHVHFSERNIVRPRPLESGQTFSDLKAVADRPPTPIPSEEYLRITTQNEQLVDEITLQSEKQLREKMARERISSGKDLVKRLPSTPSLTETREKLKKSVLEKLEGLRSEMKKGGKYMSQIPESALDLLPRMDDTHRESFVNDMSKLVSEIIGTTLKQAQTIMHDAMKITLEKLGAMADEDSDDGAEDAPSERAKKAAGAETGVDNFKPVFGGKDLSVNSNVMVSSLAAISVKHSADRLGHEGHSHRPPVSHMKEFFKSRASVSIIPTSVRTRVADRKRHSMPTTLPECMDPSQMHGRHSFMTVMKPDLQTLPEYRDKTQRQVETVLQDHSVFGRIQEASPASSEEDVLKTEDLSDAASSATPHQPQQLPPAVVESGVSGGDEAPDPVADQPGDDDRLGAARQSPRHSVSMPAQRRGRRLSTAVVADAADIPLKMIHSLTASRMMLRCDSDPRLSLRTSTAEVNVDIHEHSVHCVDHEVHDETEHELRKLESSALGFSAERTASASEVVVHQPAQGVPLRKSGSADGGPLLLAEVDSDDETELLVRHPRQEAAGSDAPTPAVES